MSAGTLGEIFEKNRNVITILGFAFILGQQYWSNKDTTKTVAEHEVELQDVTPSIYRIVNSKDEHVNSELIRLNREVEELQKNHWIEVGRRQGYQEAKKERNANP